MNKPPNKWLAVVLSLLANPLGLLYVGAPALAAALFVASLLVAALDVMQTGEQSAIRFATVLPWVFAVGAAVWSYRLAKRADPDAPRHWSSRWMGMIGLYVAIVVVVVGVRLFAYEPFRIPSTAMEPTLPIGSKIVVQKWGYGHYGTFGVTPFKRAISAPLERGDIVVFDFPKDPTQTYIKRLIGLPGDTVLYKDGRLTINGEPAERQAIGDYTLSDRAIDVNRFQEKLGKTQYEVVYFKAPRGELPQEAFPHKDQCQYAFYEIRCTVPLGHYFMLGDNRDNSMDSRIWGFVPADMVIGKVVATFK